MRNATIVLSLLFTLAASATGCDAPTDDAEDRPAAASFRSINAPGKPWGPCSAVNCEFGSECIKAEVGTYCAPNCASPACTAVQVDACGEIIGEGTASCWGDFICKRLCAGDVDCGLGMVCADEGFCVNPGE